MFRDIFSSRNGTLPLTRGGPLDLLRFLAAFCMVVFHYGNDAPTPIWFIHPAFGRGYLSTDFFLIVSGYVLSRIYGDRVAGGSVTSGGFLYRRATRVLPAHFMMIAAFVVMVVGCGLIGLAPQQPDWFDWKQLPAQIFLLQSLGVKGGHGWNEASWTLGPLITCYALFPTVWKALQRIKSGLAVLALSIAAYAVTDFCSRKFLGAPAYRIHYEWGLVRGLPLFFIGVGLARFTEQVFLKPAVAKGLGLLAAAVLIGIQPLGNFDLISVGLIAVIVYAAGAVPVKKRSYVLEKAALVSFAIFITNEFVRVPYFGVVELVTHHAVLSAHAKWLVWCGALATAVAFAVGFHYLVDMPTQRWIRSRGFKPAKKQTAVPMGETATA